MKGPHFTFVDLEQGTREWLEWRHEGIGASDAPSIMDENPWKGADDLLREKRRPIRNTPSNDEMERGKRLEPEARRRYVAKTGKDVKPACLQSCEHHWMRASVDGISANGDTVIEIKCGDSVYRDTAQGGCVPRRYYGQLQHILAVTGLEEIHFWCYLPNKPELFVSVKRDDKYIEELIQVEREFWDQVTRPKTPKFSVPSQAGILELQIKRRSGTERIQLRIPPRGPYEPEAFKKQKHQLMKFGCQDPESIRVLGREQATFMIDELLALERREFASLLEKEDAQTTNSDSPNRALVLVFLAVLVGGSYWYYHQPSSEPTISEREDNSPTPALAPNLRFTSAEEAKAEAVRRFPELGIAGSKFNNAFLVRHKLYQQTRPDYFRDPSWPMRLAEEVSRAAESR